LFCYQGSGKLKNRMLPKLLADENIPARAIDVLRAAG